MKGFRAALIAVLLAFGGLVLCAPIAGARVVRLANGHFAGIMLRPGAGSAFRVGPTVLNAATPLTSSDDVGYQGGPVLHTTDPYLIFWDPSGNTLLPFDKTVLERYFTDAAADNASSTDVYALHGMRQYTDSTGYAAAGQTFSATTQAIDDTEAYPTPPGTGDCPSTTGFTACVTDTQIQTELNRLIAADGLPTDGPTSETEFPANAPVYIVITPVTTNECFTVAEGGGCAAGGSGGFCAYHANYDDGADNLIYAVVPFATQYPTVKACQGDDTTPLQAPNGVDSNGDSPDLIADNMSHENAESITDPLPNSDPAWLSDNGWELADQCEEYSPTPVENPSNNPNGPSNPNAYEPTLAGSASAGTLADQDINGDDYYTQTLWSNTDDNCETAPVADAITAAFTDTAPAAPSASVSFDPASSTDTGGFSSATWSFGDGSAGTFTNGSPATVTHNYAHVGTYTVTLTLVDTHGNVQTVSHTVTIALAPTVAFTAAPALLVKVGSPVAFSATATDPNSGGSITGYAWNFGDGSATGSGATPTHSYSKPGAYTVTLTVTSIEGVTASVTHAITAAAPPSAAFSVGPVHPASGSATDFSGAGSSAETGATIASYAWNFGDGSAIGSGATPTHTYAKPGTYTVTLEVTDSNGLTGTRTASVVVLAPGKISKITTKTVKGHEYVVVTVSEGGTLKFGSKTVTVGSEGSVRFELVPTKSEKKHAKHHRAAVKLTIAYTPPAGGATVTTRTFSVKV